MDSCLRRKDDIYFLSNKIFTTGYEALPRNPILMALAIRARGRATKAEYQGRVLVLEKQPTHYKVFFQVIDRGSLRNHCPSLLRDAL